MYQAKQVSALSPQQGIPCSSSEAANLTGAQTEKTTPQMQVLKTTKRFGQYQLEPLPVGAGITLGNALRRTLLSSIPGAAVTGLQMKGMTHEFSTIPNVREDMTAFILNLKAVRLKFKADQPATLTLNHRGSGLVTAGDLICPPHVEIVNPDQPLFTADNDQAQVDLSLTAEMGTGYSPSEDREPRTPGTIPIDAVFSPIRRANFKVERGGVAETARQGHPFERLKLDLTTDGTCSPEAALRQAAQHLTDQFAMISSTPYQQQGPPATLPYHRPLKQLALQPRTLNALQRAGFSDVNGLMKHIRKTGLDNVKGLGVKSKADLLQTLAHQNLSAEDQLILQALENGTFQFKTNRQSAPEVHP